MCVPCPFHAEEEVEGETGSERRKRLKTAHVDADLSVLGVDATEGSSLAVGELVHGRLSEVEASAGVVNGEDVDGLAVVGDAVAGTALGVDVS